MSRSAKVSLRWADGEHVFRLGITELEELQDKSGHGPMEVGRRLQSGEWMVAEVREPIRLGLIGGGLQPREASALVERYVDRRPDWTLNAKLALAIVHAALFGVGEDPVPKPEREGGTSPPSRTDAGGSAGSTAPEPPSGSAPKRSGGAASGSSPRPARGGRKPTGRKAKPKPPA